MIKISVDAVVVHLMVEDNINLSLRLSNGTYVDFPIYDESFPLVKSGKRFRLTLEEVEMEEVGSLLKGKPATESSNEAYQAMNDVLAQNSKMGKTPYHIIDELRRDVAALGTIKKALNQLEVRNEERLASYSDAEIEAHRKHIQEVIMPEVKKVGELITGTAGEVNAKIKCHVCVNLSTPSVCKECINLSKFTPTSKTSCKGCVHEDTSASICSFCEEFNRFSLKEELRPMSDKEITEFIKTRSEYPEELAQEYQGIFDKVSKGPFCQGCKHIGVNPESEPCDVCFEGSRYDDSHKAVLPMGKDQEVNPDEKPSTLIETAKKFVNEVYPAPPLSEPIYSARRRKCGKCANSSTPIVCIMCIKYSKFEPSRYK